MRRLFYNDIIRGPHDAIGAGGVDFHLLRRELVKKKGRAPAVAVFILVVDARTGWEGNPQVFRIAAVERFRDFAVRPDGILAKGGAVVAEADLNIFQLVADHVGRCGFSRFG